MGEMALKLLIFEPNPNCFHFTLIPFLDDFENFSSPSLFSNRIRNHSKSKPFRFLNRIRSVNQAVLDEYFALRRRAPNLIIFKNGMVSIWNGFDFDWRTEKESQNSQNLLEMKLIKDNEDLDKCLSWFNDHNP